MEKLHHIRQIIKETAAKSPLAAKEITLLGASKGQGTAKIEDFIKSGLSDFGENRVQEAAEKWPKLKKKYPEIRLHLIGHLQTNKVKEALALFDVIQTIDRPKLAESIAKSEESRVASRESDKFKKEFYVQINTGEEPQKSGIIPKDAADFIAYCHELKLNIVGLMCVPPVNEMPAPHFALLRKIALENNLKKLSIGMSGDFATAIRMGSSCVRIGTALFGNRESGIED